MKKVNLSSGLSSYQIKLIAVFFMTLYNLASYGGNLDFISNHSTLLCVLGQTSGPLFLYMLTESIRYTKNRRYFLVRLYLGAIGVGIFTSLTNLYTGHSVGIFRSDNVMFSYFYTALYIISIEKIIKGFQEHCKRNILHGFIGILVTIIIHIIVVNIRPHIVDNMYSASWFDSILTSPMYVEYTPMFILLGILMYFLNGRLQKAIAVLLFSLISSNYWLADFCISTPISTFFNYPQRYMSLALLFILLYNGTRGKEHKAFFYTYYPLHRYCIALIAFAIKKFALSFS